MSEQKKNQAFITTINQCLMCYVIIKVKGMLSSSVQVYC